MTDKEVMQQALRALVVAEAGLADIGDADREPGDDLAWCEARAAQALELPRAAIIALRAAIAQPVQQTPVRQTLTDVDIEKCVEMVWGSFAEFDEVRIFTRAIEAAHGITTPKETK